MSIWREKIANHQIHDVLENIKNEIDDWDKTNDYYEDFQRFKRVASFVSATIRSTDYLLLHETMLNEINNHANQLLNSIKNFKQNEDQTQLNNGHNQATNLVKSSRILPRITTEKQAQEIGKIVDEISKDVFGVIDSFHEKFEESKANHDNIIKKQTELSQQIEEEKKHVQQQISRIDQTINTINQTFQNNEQNRNEQINKNIQEINNDYQSEKKQWNNEIEKISRDFNAKVNTEIEKYRKLGEDHITELENIKIKASNLFQIIGNIGVTGDFQNNAEKNRKSANIWRVIALVSMLVAVGGAIVVVWRFPSTDLGWQYTALKLITAIAFTVPSAYAARESTKHRELERKYRKMELELSSIDPFIENITQEKREQLKTTIADRIFGQPEYNNEEDEISKNTLFDLLKEIMKRVTSN